MDLLKNKKEANLLSRFFSNPTYLYLYLCTFNSGIMDRLQEAENDYIRLIQQRTLKLNISPSAIPTTEEIQAAVEGIMSFYFMMFSLLGWLSP